MLGRHVPHHGGSTIRGWLVSTAPAPTGNSRGIAALVALPLALCSGLVDKEGQGV